MMSEPGDRREAGPVFVGGMGRSGTTLASVILDSHPDLHLAPELHFGTPPDLGPTVLHAIELIEKAEGPSKASMLARRHPDLKSALQFVTRCERAGLEPQVLQELITESCRATGGRLELFDHRMDLIGRIGRRLAREAGKPRWGMKIMRQIRELERFRQHSPDCRVIHVVRDGRDVAASQLIDHSSWGASDVEQAAREWLELIAQVHLQMKDDPSVIEIRYEDLVRENEPACRTLLDFLDLEWNDDVLRHEKKQHAVTASRVHHPSAAAVTRPINDESISRYQRDLSEAQIAAYQAVAGDLLARLGYQPYEAGTVDTPADQPPKRRGIHGFIERVRRSGDRGTRS